MYYETREITYYSTKDLDKNLNELKDEDITPCLVLDNSVSIHGGIATITFKINDK